jgi:hypothetical protein
MEIHKQQTDVQITDKQEVSSEVKRKLDNQAQQAIEYALIIRFIKVTFRCSDTTLHNLKKNILLSLYFFYVADLLQE